MKRTLILDANQRSALAVTRSLGGRKIPLVCADETTSSLAGCSCYSLKHYRYPSPLTEPDNFIDFIIDLCKKEDIRIIMPMTELTLGILLKNRSSLGCLKLPFASLDTVEKLENKNKLMSLAESIRVPIPKTHYAASPKNLSVILEKLSYPLIIKPGKSWICHDGKWIRSEVEISRSPVAAVKTLKKNHCYQLHSFMIQEFIPGNGAGIFAIYDHGDPIAFFSHRRLREKPPQGGVSVLSESCAIDPVLEKYSRALLDHVKWHGVAMIEFRITPEGKPYLMEINTRFWGSLQLAIDAGVDFPWLLYQTCMSSREKKLLNHNKSTPEYKTGIRLRWILGDLDSLYLVLRNTDIDLFSKLKKIIAFFTPHPFITRHEVNRIADFKPFIWELQQYLKNIFRK